MGTTPVAPDVQGRGAQDMATGGLSPGARHTSAWAGRNLARIQTCRRSEPVDRRGGILNKGAFSSQAICVLCRTSLHCRLR